jgi:hypothetical protein
LPNYVEGSNIFACEPCPDGADCTEPGSKWTNLRALVGWWRATNVSENFYRCLLREQCTGGAATSNVFGEGGSGCRENREGILCAHCKSGYKEGDGGACVECPQSSASIASAIFIAIGVCLLIAVQMWIIIDSGSHLEKRDELAQIDASESESEGGEVSGLNLKQIQELDLANNEQEEDDDDEEEENEDDETSKQSRSRSSKSDPKSPRSPKSPREESESDADEDGDVEDSKRSQTTSSRKKRHVDVNLMNKRLAMLQLGPMKPRSSFVHKLKIFLGFLQIVTNVGTSLEIQWFVIAFLFFLFLSLFRFLTLCCLLFACHVSGLPPTRRLSLISISRISITSLST